MDLKAILKDKSHIHFIGIGGSGMFPLVQILHSKGKQISGTDNNPSDTLSKVKEMGIKVYMEHTPDNIRGADLIIYSAAIMEDNPELIAAKSSDAVCIGRSELLGAVTAEYGNAICVCGTHGKTTATSMITQIMMTAGEDPSAVIGGRLEVIGGSGRVGSSDMLVCEACEFADTFLMLWPDISLVLNIDEDHLDYFKNLDNLILSFSKFIAKTSRAVIINGDDENSLKAAKDCPVPLYTFGLSHNNDFYPDNITTDENFVTHFDFISGGQKLTRLRLSVPGRHNLLNAVAACAAAVTAGLAPGKLDGLEQYKGVARRFEILGEYNGAVIADDYAHHPAEVEATLTTARSLGFDRIIAIHQPFTYSRTAALKNEFARSLSIADVVILSDIMGSREKNTYGIHSQDLADLITGAKYFSGFDQIAEYTKSIAKKGDLVITLGCGDVYKIGKRITMQNAECRMQKKIS